LIIKNVKKLSKLKNFELFRTNKHSLFGKILNKQWNVFDKKLLRKMSTENEFYKMEQKHFKGYISAE